jgi:ATP-dependent DNA helicase RecQ
MEVANRFLREGRPIQIEPRKRWPSGLPGMKRTIIEQVNESGVALCGYYDTGWSTLIKRGRFEANFYSDELVKESVALLQAHLATLDDPPRWITAIPSLRRPTLVPSFAARLATGLGLRYQPVLKHVKQHPEQASLRNSFQQVMNVYNVFKVEDAPLTSPVLLVDDIADSKWTLTVAGALLRKSGSGLVHPYVLATTSAD